MDNDKKVPTKSEQFLIDVGLFYNVATKPEPTGGVIYTACTGVMEEPKNAIAIHINNLVLHYGEQEVRAAFDKHFTIADIENELRKGVI